MADVQNAPAPQGSEAPTFTLEDLSLLEAEPTGGEGDQTATADAATDDTVEEGTPPSQADDGDGEADGETGDLAASDEGDQTASLLDDGKEEDEAGEKEDAAKSDKEVPLDWASTRARAVDRYASRLESNLKKSVPAADLPKELAKAKQRVQSQLARYATHEDALLALVAAQDKIRSGAYKERPGEDATSEEMAEWRAANEIPDSPDGYDIAKVNGYTWSDADAPALDKLRERGHSLNFDNRQINGIAQLYAELVQEQRQNEEERVDQLDRTDLQTARDTLRDEWRGEFQPSLTLMRRLLQDTDIFPDGHAEKFAQARFPDGRRIINDPSVARFLVEAARERYGEASMIRGEAAAAMTSEKNEIEALMQTDIDRYHNAPWKDSGVTAAERLLQLNREEAQRSRGRRSA